MADLGADCIFAALPADILPKGQEAVVRGEIEDRLTETLERDLVSSLPFSVRH